jgi:hypothetical protein
MAMTGHARAMAIVQPVDQMHVAGSAASRADGELAGEMMRLGARRESRDLFVADMDPLDLALAPNRVREAVEAVSYDAIDPLDAGHSKDFDKLVGNSLHDFSPREECGTTSPIYATR